MEPITVTCCHCNRTQKLTQSSAVAEDTFKCTTCAELCVICTKNKKVGVVPGSVEADPDICFHCSLDLDNFAMCFRIGGILRIMIYSICLLMFSLES